jgi:hypothetical protein
MILTKQRVTPGPTNARQLRGCFKIRSSTCCRRQSKEPRSLQLLPEIDEVELRKIIDSGNQQIESLSCGPLSAGRGIQPVTNPELLNGGFKDPNHVPLKLRASFPTQGSRVPRHPHSEQF